MCNSPVHLPQMQISIGKILQHIAFAAAKHKEGGRGGFSSTVGLWFSDSSYEVSHKICLQVKSFWFPQVNPLYKQCAMEMQNHSPLLDNNTRKLLLLCLHCQRKKISSIAKSFQSNKNTRPNLFNAQRAFTALPRTQKLFKLLCLTAFASGIPYIL